MNRNVKDTVRNREKKKRRGKNLTGKTTLRCSQLAFRDSEPRDSELIHTMIGKTLVLQFLSTARALASPCQLPTSMAHTRYGSS